MAMFARAGCEAVAPAIIQPADVFLDVIGEDLRARTYVFSDPEGVELCLRPDLTVPTCRLYLARHANDLALQGSAEIPARYCYNGSAFRFQPHGANAAHPNEFRQAGIEMIGDTDREQAETDVLALIRDGLQSAYQGPLQIRMGDLGLFHALLGDLAMPARGRQRLRAQFWRPDAFKTALGRLTSQSAGSLSGLPRDLVASLDASDLTRSEALVAAYLDANKIDLIGARTLTDVTAGLLAAAGDAKAEPIPDTTARLIESYLTVKGPAPHACAKLQTLMAGAGPRSAKAMTAFRRRLDLLQAAGIDTASLEFSAEFGRNLEYYTGFVFDVVSPKLAAQSPIAGGGRYDNLMKAVGAPRDVPAVGSAIHTERLLSIVNGSQP